MEFILPALSALATTLAVTPLVRRAAVFFGAVDRPNAARKIHSVPTPLMGGVAVLAGLVVGTSVAFALGLFPAVNISSKNLLGLLLACLVLVIGGVLDDKYNLKPYQSILSPILACVIVVSTGFGIEYVTNPLGGQLRLDAFEKIIFWLNGVPYKMTLPADIFTVVWLMALTYATKLADGVDGLVTGFAAIGAVMLAAVSFLGLAVQSDVAVLSLIVAGAFIGFLFFNFNPASIFLGESGSTMAGFLLGALAIVSGGKVAVTLFVLALPVLDVALVMARRVMSGRNPFSSADRGHLHHRLLDAGLTQRQTVLLLWFAAALAGSASLVGEAWSWHVALMLSASVILGAVGVYQIMRRKRKNI